MSFAATLRDPTAEIRRYAFAEHNWHVHQAHERMVRHGDWLYIRNAWPERQLLCVEAGPRFPAGKELWAEEAAGRLGEGQRDIFRVPRAAEELYHVGDDPHQLHDLAASAAHHKTLEGLRGVLDRWSEETADTIPDDPTPDREDAHGVKNPGFRRGTMPGTEKNAARVLRPGPR